MSLLREPGDLAQTPLAAVLLDALNERASGVLEVVHAGGTSRLWFQDGRPVGAQVFQGFRPLGMMLLQQGLIDIDALSKSLAVMAETKRPQGEILVEMGAVSAADVERTLEEQQAGYFGVIAALDAAPFAFDASIPVPRWTRGSRLSPARTIVDALERPQAIALVASALQPVAAGGVRLLPGYREHAAEFRWTDAERALAARLEAPIRLESFFAASDVPPERARAMLAALLLLGLAGPDAGAEVPGPDLVVEPAPASTPVPRETPIANPPPALTPPPSARRSDPAEARARRQRLLQQAMRNMGVGPFAGPRPPADDAAAGGDREPAQRRGARAGATEAERHLRDALLAVVPRTKERDFFTRLGVAETAGRQDVKSAFLALARQFHPDRFTSPALADLQNVVKDFFASVNEAYEVLSDDKKRAEYVAARHAKGTARGEAARVDFQKGEACLRTRDFARGRGFLESAVRADPRPEYQAALAFACLTDPGRKDRDRARKLLAEATKDTSCDRALYVAGLLARDEGDDGGAERWFRAAAKVNPKNADAVRELRLAEARRAEKRR
ncbi:MAG TPA: DnaJ domain-containing protein [Anaeromyxobacter sp.]|nr:DnaJ domain-containing protein [Anaeromyxobacter sp.]